MARSKSIDVRAALRKVFSNRRLRSMARETGTVVRQRKVDPVALFWTVVLGFGAGRERSIAGLRRAYERATGQCLEESSFYKRFSEGFVTMLEHALVHALEHDVGVGRKLRGHLARFVDVLITDATVVRLHDLLARQWPGCRTNHTLAALKAHWVMSVAGKSRQSGEADLGASPRRAGAPGRAVGRGAADAL